MENLWEMVAKARGLELDEEFLYSLGNFEYKYRISERGLEYYNNDGGRWTFSECNSEFIKGIGKIEKLPFRPQKSDEYYTFVFNKDIAVYNWGGTSSDYARLMTGIVFRTREEAEAYIPTWLDRISKL